MSKRNVTRRCWEGTSTPSQTLKPIPFQSKFSVSLEIKWYIINDQMYMNNDIGIDVDVRGKRGEADGDGHVDAGS